MAIGVGKYWLRQRFELRSAFAFETQPAGCMHLVIALLVANDRMVDDRIDVRQGCTQNVTLNRLAQLTVRAWLLPRRSRWLANSCQGAM